MVIAQTSPEWEAYRQSLKGIGASQASVVLGLSPFETPYDLWRRLTGRAPAKVETPAMARGKRLEQVAADWTAEELGVRLRRVNRTVRDPRWPNLFCHPDRAVIGQRRLVQIKTKGRAYDERDELGEYGVPLHVEAQVQTELALTGYAVATVALMTFQDLHLYEVPAVRLVAAAMCDRLNEWYERHIVQGEPVSPYGPIREAVDQATTEQEELVAALRALRMRLSSLELDEQRVTDLLKDSMAGGLALVGGGWRVTWKPTKDRVLTDWKAALDAAEANGLDVRSYVEAQTTTVPGSRPFRLTYSGGGTDRGE
jgi:putative phage-type endonuclease